MILAEAVVRLKEYRASFTGTLDRRPHVSSFAQHGQVVSARKLAPEVKALRFCEGRSARGTSTPDRRIVARTRFLTLDSLALHVHHSLSLKPGKIVILLNGRFAGKKAVIIQTNDQGTNKHQYGHAIVAGIEKPPRKVTKRMSEKKMAARSRITPFIKLVNYNHLMPTRYTIDLGEEAKKAVNCTAFSTAGNKEDNPEARKTSRVAVAKAFEEKYKAGKNKWFYQKLAF